MAVLIVGGGPTGMTLALELSLHGVKSIVAEMLYERGLALRSTRHVCASMVQLERVCMSGNSGPAIPHSDPRAAFALPEDGRCDGRLCAFEPVRHSKMTCSPLAVINGKSLEYYRRLGIIEDIRAIGIPPVRLHSCVGLS
jgi:hypothetical protein